jgi:hypothetical protein
LSQASRSLDRVDEHLAGENANPMWEWAASGNAINSAQSAAESLRAVTQLIETLRHNAG